ncbi:eukaryotic integral membrane protein-domain-containing protein [Crepidotus variabilis]|uniref:Eukaryotic integral membrane protein-domain-containing protein n=1 Tax=Crepidotus variabilis TaxID=179855 RepID=A0A9P6EUK9_9AGAR|nr:eukaryotic integral membrane protein-domain-containing protein [Crepidotus variabilis]
MAVLASPIVLIQSVPPITRAFTAITIISSALYGYLSWKGLGVEAVRYMTMVPGFAIYSPWTLFTSAFVETTVFEFVATIIFVPPSLKYLERLWGSIETVKFIVATIVASNIITLAVNCIEFIGTRNADLFLYGMPYHGQMALQIGILVAFTQLIPEHQVQLFGFIKARVKTLPMAYLTLSTVLCLVGYQCPWIIIQFGWYVSWVYLRFYKKNTADAMGGTDTYGDRSETFSLISWFPPFMHYPLTLLGNFVHSLATRLHLIPTSGPDLEHGAYAQVPGTTRAEAERRRAMALKALDQRLANNTSPSMNNSSNNAAATQSRVPVGITPSGSTNNIAKDTEGVKTKSDTR